MSSPAKTTPRGPAGPAAPPLGRVKTAAAAEILARYEPSKDAAALADDKLAPYPYVERLLDAQLFEDAIAFLAYALPRREALAWAHGCAQEVTPADAKKELVAALAAAEKWIAAPADEDRRAAMVAAEAATYGNPQGCPALSVFFSEGSMSPPDCPPVPVGEWFCARTVAASVHLACLARGPEHARPLAQDFATRGVDAGTRPPHWEKK
jgi:hypothetical protein